MPSHFAHEIYLFNNDDINSSGILVIPHGPIFIEEYSCAWGSMSAVIIPNSVNDIEPHAFLCCTNLSSVTLPTSITSISDIAFEECNTLSEIVIATDDEKEIERIKNLLPENLRNKVVNPSNHAQAGETHKQTPTGPGRKFRMFQKDLKPIDTAAETNSDHDWLSSY